MAVRDWLPAGRVDQKRNDALEMLSEMTAAAERSEATAAPFAFEWTSHWDAFVSRATHEVSHADSSTSSLHREILEELCLEGEEAYGRVRDRALLRVLAAREASRLGFKPSREAERARLGKLRATANVAVVVASARHRLISLLVKIIEEALEGLCRLLVDRCIDLFKEARDRGDDRRTTTRART